MLKTGLTSTTPQNLQLNAGVFLKSYTKGTSISASDIIGATRGGGSFSAVPTIHQVAVDGAPTYVKGLERIDEWVVQFSVNAFLEFTADLLARALGVAVTDTTVNDVDHKLTVSHSIASGDYKTIYWVGDLSNGQNVVIKLNNALNLAGLTITANDKGEGTYPLTLTAHYDISDLDTAPFEIIIEGASE